MSRFSARTMALGLLFALTPAVTVFESSTVEANVAADQSFEKVMGGIVGGLKALSRSLKDPEQNEASLASIALMQKHVHAAKELAPTNMEEIAEGKRAAHKLAYRADMARFLRELCEMEIDVCEGNNDKANARIRGGLLPMRDAGHEKYQQE